MALVIVCNTPDLNQMDRCVLEIDGENRVLYIKLRWLKKTERWLMSIFDDEGNPVLRNIPLIAGQAFPSADLLDQFGYLGIGHASCFPTEHIPSTEQPSFDNLGLDKEWSLLWGLPDE